MKNAPARVSDRFDRPRSEALDYALDMVQLMAESGQIAVPVKPSPGMLAAGAKAGGVTVITAWKVYHARVEAA